MDTLQRHGRTIEKELFVAAAPERAYRAFTEKSELERWFVTHAEVELAPGGVYNLTFGSEQVAGKVVAFDPPRRFVFSWDDGPQYGGVTTCAIDFIPESDGTLVRLVHTGFGDGRLWDELYDGINGGWNTQLEFMRHWLEHGAPKQWATTPHG